MMSKRVRKDVPGELWDAGSRYKVSVGNELTSVLKLSVISSDGCRWQSGSFELCVPHAHLQTSCTVRGWHYCSKSSNTLNTGLVALLFSGGCSLRDILTKGLKFDRKSV